MIASRKKDPKGSGGGVGVLMGPYGWVYMYPTSLWNDVNTRPFAWELAGEGYRA